MLIANDIFHADRLGLITGSKCHVLFPEKGDGKAGQTTYAQQLAMQKFFNYFDTSGGWQTEHGNMNEHGAFEYFKTNYAFDCEKGGFIQNGEFGGTSDALCNKYGVDFKCPTTLENWLSYLFKGISKQQYHQCQMYMWLFDKPSWKIAAYLTETKWMEDTDQQYPVPLDKRVILVEVQKEVGWEDTLLENSKYTLEQRDIFYNQLMNEFSTNNQNK